MAGGTARAPPATESSITEDLRAIARDQLAQLFTPFGQARLKPLIWRA